MKLPLPTPLSRTKTADLTASWLVQPVYRGKRVIITLPKAGRVTIAQGGKTQKVSSIDKLQVIRDAWTFRDEDYIIDAIAPNHNPKRLVLYDGAFRSEWKNPVRPYEERFRYLAAQEAMWRHDLSEVYFRLAMVKSFKTYNPTRQMMQSVAFLTAFTLYDAKTVEGVYYRRAEEPVRFGASKSFLKVLAKPPPAQ